MADKGKGKAGAEKPSESNPVMFGGRLGEGRQAEKQAKTKTFTFRIAYPGSVISVNHYRGRRRDGGEYVKPEARAWMEELGWLIKTQHLEDWRLPLHVTCSGTFQSTRSAPDLSNLSKCALDSIEETSGVNDRDMRWHDGDRRIDQSAEPSLKITIEESP